MLVLGKGEASFRLVHPVLAHVPIEHSLLELGELDAGGLYPVPIGHIYEMDLRHVYAPSFVEITGHPQNKDSPVEFSDPQPD